MADGDEVETDEIGYADPFAERARAFTHLAMEAEHFADEKIKDLSLQMLRRLIMSIKLPRKIGDLNEI